MADNKKQGMFMQLEQRNKIRKSFVYVMCGGKIVQNDVKINFIDIYFFNYFLNVAYTIIPPQSSVSNISLFYYLYSNSLNIRSIL